MVVKKLHNLCAILQKAAFDQQHSLTHLVLKIITNIDGILWQSTTDRNSPISKISKIFVDKN